MSALLNKRLDLFQTENIGYVFPGAENKLIVRSYL